MQRLPFLLFERLELTVIVYTGEVELHCITSVVLLLCRATAQRSEASHA